jgi:peptidylprolyl isomerase
MRYPASVGSAVLVALALAACGTADSNTTAPAASGSSKLAASRPEKASRKGPLAMSKAEIAQLPRLVVTRRTGSPPRKLLVRDLRKGTGAPIRPNDAILVRYYDVSYDEAQRKPRTGRFGPSRFGLNEVVRGWQLGLPGMKVGGRRELVVPPRLHFAAWTPKMGYGHWTTIYVIDLLAVYPAGA